jgi:hypothetical protein
MSNANKAKQAANAGLTAQQVNDYLLAHPRFFDQHPDVLANLTLPHDSGEAISLVQRQINLLRERNLETRERLDKLLESARANDELFDKTKRLVLGLLEAQDLKGLVTVLYESLGADFNVEFHNLILLGESNEMPESQAKIVNLELANNTIGTLLRTNRALCGILNAEELEFLFGNDGVNVGSVAVVPLYYGQVYGVLAIGNSDPNLYRSSMGTLFLGYIAEVLNRIAPRLIE